LEKDILECVLRLCGVSEHFHRQRIERTAQSIVESAEGALIAAANPRDHFLIQYLLRCRCFRHVQVSLAKLYPTGIGNR
jgi:hypothetical protein